MSRQVIATLLSRCGVPDSGVGLTQFFADGDDYTPLLDGQYLDVTGVPAGLYELVHWVNPGRELKESSYGNNAASIVIRLDWPGGLGAPPRIDVVRRCGDGRRCLTAR